MDKTYKEFYKNTLVAIQRYAEDCIRDGEPMNAEMLAESLAITLDDEGRKLKRFKEVVKKYSPEMVELYEATTK